MAEDGVGAEEGHVHTAVTRRLGLVAHGAGPVLVVTEGEEGLVPREELPPLVEVDVGPVRDVEAQGLDQGDEGELVAEEVGRTSAHRVRPVEGHDP